MWLLQNNLLRIPIQLLHYQSILGICYLEVVWITIYRAISALPIFVSLWCHCAIILLYNLGIISNIVGRFILDPSIHIICLPRCSGIIISFIHRDEIVLILWPAWISGILYLLLGIIVRHGRHTSATYDIQTLLITLIQILVVASLILWGIQLPSTIKLRIILNDRNMLIIIIRLRC